jgi:hypothetical protein
MIEVKPTLDRPLLMMESQEGLTNDSLHARVEVVRVKRRRADAAAEALRKLLLPLLFQAAG